MRQGVFLYCTDRKTAFDFEKQLQSELGIAVKEKCNDLATLDSDMEIVLLYDRGEIPTDYKFRGHKVIIVTEGMDFTRWKRLYERNIPVVKIDDHLSYLKDGLFKAGYQFTEQQKTEAPPPVLGPVPTKLKEGIATVIGIKDGVGVSTIALNLAAYVRNVFPETRVVLLDLDNRFSSLYKFITNNVGVSEIDLGTSLLTQLKRKMYRHQKLGFYIIPSHKALEPENFNAETLCQELKQHFDVIIVDAGTSFSSTVFHTIHCSSNLLLVADQRPELQEDSLVFINKMLPSVGIQIPSIHVVLNRALGKNKFFKAKWDYPVAQVMEDDNIPDYESKKLIYVLGNKKSSLADCVSNLSQTMGLQQKEILQKKFRHIFQ